MRTWTESDAVRSLGSLSRANGGSGRHTGLAVVLAGPGILWHVGRRKPPGPGNSRRGVTERGDGPPANGRAISVVSSSAPRLQARRWLCDAGPGPVLSLQCLCRVWVFFFSLRV